MAQINPSVPTVGADVNNWGTKLNAALAAIIAQGNSSDTRIGKLEPPTGSSSGLVATTDGTGGIKFLAPTGGTSTTTPAATTTTQGTIRLSGHLAGTADQPQLVQVGSSAATGTFGSATQIPIITRDAFGRITNVTTVAAQTATGLTNPMTAAGDLIVGGSSGAPIRLIGNTLAAKRVLIGTGTGTTAGTPTWGQLAVADVVGAQQLATQYVGVNAQTGTSYAPTLGDAGKLVTMGNSAANTFTLPSNTAVAFPVGTWIDVAQYGAGATSFGFASGVVVRSPNNLLTIERQYRMVRAVKIATNEWLLTGHFATTSTGGGQTTDPGNGGSTTPTLTNLISNQSIQNAADVSKFTATAATATLDSAVAKSGGTSIKVAPDGSSAYPYLGGKTAAEWAPVTAGTQYTGVASVRLDANISAAFNAYLVWYDASGNQLGIGNSNGPVTGVLNGWVQVASTGVAPSGAATTTVFVEYAAAGAVLLAANTIHVDEFAVNQGTNTTWTSGQTTGGTTSPASITDTGFTYSTGWSATTSGTTEHYTSTVGATASVQFSLNGPATFSLKGKQDPSNGTMSVSVDGGTAVSVSAYQATAVDNATLWTSPTLSTGSHTIVVTVTSPDGTIQGASITNGSFVAPSGTTTPSNPGTGGGTGTSGGNTTLNGKIIGGPVDSTNPSGYAPPTTDAYPGYTNILVQDFDTAFAEGRANGTSVLGSGWFSYEGQENGNYSGMNWDTDQISATGSVVTMRNTNAGSNCQALTVMYTDSANVGKTHKQQAMAYGKTMIRMKARGSSGYKIAFLMWPTTDVWNDGEIDFPEGDTVSPNPTTSPYTMTANSHNVTGNPVNGIYTDAINVSGLGKNGVIDDGKYHTFTLHWDPSQISFEMDGVVMRTITDSAYIPKVPMRWVLQCEPTAGQEKTAANYIDIDWVAAWKRG